MINMGMAQYDRVDICGVKGKWLVVAGFILTSALQQAAIKQNALITNRQQVARAGNFTGSAKKLNTQGHKTPCF